MSSSLGRPTAVPCAFSKRHRRGAPSLSASMHGVSAWRIALNSSSCGPSPQPSSTTTSSGLSGRGMLGCAFRRHFSSGVTDMPGNSCAASPSTCLGTELRSERATSKSAQIGQLLRALAPSRGSRAPGSKAAETRRPVRDEASGGSDATLTACRPRRPGASARFRAAQGGAWSCAQLLPLRRPRRSRFASSLRVRGGCA